MCARVDGRVRIVRTEGAIHSSPTPDHGREYRERGVVLDTFPLADPSVIPRLTDDAVEFERAVRDDRASGRHRVPYAITDAIRDVAHDANITALVEAVLGSGQRWVMWGSNIQSGTPNQAGSWHVDIESHHWPTITVAVGLDGCTSANSTRCIPFSHGLPRSPMILDDRSDTDEALAAATALDPRCSEVIAPRDFATGRFYAFNARSWHSGEIATSGDRTMLFLHYQSAADPRIPLMTSYADKTWSKEPAPYLVGPSPSGVDLPVNTTLYRPPSPLRRRLARLKRVANDRITAASRSIRGRSRAS